MASDSIPFVVNAAINMPISLLAVVGNSVILASFLKNPSLISPSHVILVSLALSDLCVGLVVQPMYIVWRLNQFGFINENWRQDILFLVMVFLSAVLCLFSLLTVTVLSADRYLAMRLHLRYNEFITERRICCFLGLLGVGSVALCSVSLLFQAYDEFVGSFTAISCFVVNTVLYLKIYRVVQRHKRQINGLQSGRIPKQRTCKHLAIQNLVTCYVLCVSYSCFVLSSIHLASFLIPTVQNQYCGQNCIWSFLDFDLHEFRFESHALFLATQENSHGCKGTLVWTLQKKITFPYWRNSQGRKPS